MEDRPAPMKKPKYKIGQVVYVKFLGLPRLAELTLLKKHGRDMDRWVYYATDIKDGTVYPNVGIDNTEKVFNIDVEKTKKYLEATKG